MPEEMRGRSQGMPQDQEFGGSPYERREDMRASPWGQEMEGRR